jgi:hypothetical protein
VTALEAEPERPSRSASATSGLPQVLGCKLLRELSRPAAVDLIVCAAQDRALVEDASLFASGAVWPELTRMQVKVAPRWVGDPGRIATVALRVGPVTLKRPRNGFATTDPDTVSMTLVEACEINPPPNEDPLLWRLLTTIEVRDAVAACEIVRLYRRAEKRRHAPGRDTGA